MNECGSNLFIWYDEDIEFEEMYSPIIGQAKNNKILQ